MSTTRSRYLLLSRDLYRDQGGRIARLAYSTRRATLFAVDPHTGDALDRGDTAAIEEQQLSRLAALDAVVPADEDELARVLAALRAGSDDQGVRSFTIMPSSYCNMGCTYCGQEHYRSSPRMRATAARVEAAIAAERTEKVHVTWFGGEPLLGFGVIRELSARFIAAAARRGIGYTSSMPTNGSLLTPRMLTWLHEDCKLGSIEVTLDGPAEVHNRRRIMRNGSGTFERITSVLRDHLPAGMRLTIRVNVDAENEASVGDLIGELGRLGLRCTLSLMPVHSWGNDVSEVELEARRFAALEAQWLRLAESVGVGFGTMPTALKRTTCVATSRWSEVVDPAERVYACSEQPLVPQVRESGVLGHVSEVPAARPQGLYDDWYDSVGGQEVPCGRCPILPVCGGSCPKLWREGHVPCPSIKFNFEDRLEIAAGRLGFTRV